jgi:hypothetical protein
LVTNAATLASSNNLFRSSTNQIIFPAWNNPNATVPIQPVSYIVMADTYQDGRDFWNKLAAPVTRTPGSPQIYQPPQAPQAPVVSDIPGQAITSGESFATINLDSFVTDSDNPLSELGWTYSGNTALTVSINPAHIATITYPIGWHGSETITFTANDPNLLDDSDSATFTINGPTAVTVSSFTGASHLGMVQLDWETASEMGLIGFNLYRSQPLDGVKEKLNTDLIPAQVPDQILGASYQFTDAAEQGQRYYYWLELITHQGSELLEPLVVTADYLVRLPLMIR